MPNFSVLPPEVNSLHIFVGAGSGPMLAAAAAWDGLAGELSSAAASFGSVTSGLAAESWQGPAAAAMTSAAAPYSGLAERGGCPGRGSGWSGPDGGGRIRGGAGGYGASGDGGG